MAATRIECPACGQDLIDTAAKVGGRACPSCGHSLDAPKEPDASEPVTEPRERLTKWLKHNQVLGSWGTDGTDQEYQRTAEEILHLTAPPQAVDPGGVVAALNERLLVLKKYNGIGYRKSEDMIRDALSLIQSQADEIERLKQTLHLGGHLRPNGTLCDYLATGSVCNKCGATDRAYAVTKERNALMDGMREIAEHLDQLEDGDLEAVIEGIDTIAQRHIEGANDGKD